MTTSTPSSGPVDPQLGGSPTPVGTDEIHSSLRAQFPNVTIHPGEETYVYDCKRPYGQRIVRVALSAQ